MSPAAASVSGVTPYTAVAPPADLAGDVVLGWTTRLGSGTHRLVPDGCVDVLWLDNGSVLVCGPETAAWTFALPPGTEAVGVRFRPGRAATALGLDVPGARDRRRVLQGHVRGWSAEAPEADRVGVAVAGLLERDLSRPVAELARETALSERQLHRRCTAVFGYGPATLRRILRLQRFLRL